MGGEPSDPTRPSTFSLSQVPVRTHHGAHFCRARFLCLSQRVGRWRSHIAGEHLRKRLGSALGSVDVQGSSIWATPLALCEAAAPGAISYGVCADCVAAR